jgi:hypothetical protein
MDCSKDDQNNDSVRKPVRFALDDLVTGVMSR